MKESLIPHLKELMLDQNNDIKDQACECLIKLSLMLDVAERGEHILTIIISFAHDDDDQEARTTALDLINNLSP